MQNNSEFWNALDELVANSEIVIDRPKGTAHPKYPNFIYRLDYGYLKDTSRNSTSYCLSDRFSVVRLPWYMELGMSRNS